MSIYNLLVDYDNLREQEKLIKKRKDELAKQIKEYAINNGNKDSKGSHFAEEGKYVYGNVAKKSMKLNEDRAKALLNEKGLYREVIQIVEKVDEDKLAQYVASGDLSLEDIESITDVKVSYSLDLREKKTEDDEEMPVITTAPREASVKKPKLKLKLKSR